MPGGGRRFVRVMAALAATLTFFVAVRTTVGAFLRPHLMPALTVSTTSTGGAVGVPPHSWLLDRYLADGHGPVAYGQAVLALLGRGSSACGDGVTQVCLRRLGLHVVSTYQPDNRFWAFQGLESALYMAVAVAAIAVASWAVLARDA
jgi:hypothetical protein